MHFARSRIAFANAFDFTCVSQARCGLLSYFEPRPVEIPFKCNFSTGALFTERVALSYINHDRIHVETLFDLQAKEVLRWSKGFVSRGARGTTLL
jgi:hypothetical protein